MLLLDTHTFLWLDSAPEHLPPAVQSALRDSANTLYLSLASMWEMQIKLQLGKLTLKRPLRDVIEAQRAINDVQILPITVDHIYALAGLPPLHRDPFDRLMIAQALAEQLTFISGDAMVAQYPVPRLWG